MSQNYFYNRNGFYDKSSYRPDIDSYCLDNYPVRMTPPTAIDVAGAASDLSYRRDLIRLRQKLEERHHRIMQEKAAFQMFNEFKENFFKTYGDPVIPQTPAPPPMQTHQQQYLNLQSHPEKETYGMNSAYSSNVNLASPILSTPTVIPPPVYYPQVQNVTKSIPVLPTIPISDDQTYDTTTASIAKYIEHIQNLESEKEVFETVVKALIEYQKRRIAKTSKSHVKSAEELSTSISTKNEMESFKEEYLRKLDDVKSVAQDIKESVADFHQQFLSQRQAQKEAGDKQILTPVRDCNVPIDHDANIVTESKTTNNSARSKSYNSKGGCTVLNNIDYTLYENGTSHSTPITIGGCRKEKIIKSESERIPRSTVDTKPTITNEKCETCHGYLMQKKYHENLKHFDDTTSDTTHKISNIDHQFPEQIPECACAKVEQNGDGHNLKTNTISINENGHTATKKCQTICYPLVLKSKSDQCMRHSSFEHSNVDKTKHSSITTSKPSMCCLHQISSTTNQISHQCDSTVSRQYSTSKCYFEESKVVKCVVKQHNNNRIDPKLIVDEDATAIDDPIDADTIVTYFVKRVQDLKDQCRKYRCMKDVLQKRVEEYSGICINENSLVC